MSIVFDLKGKEILKGKPYLLPLPKNFKLEKDGNFLGEEIFLIEDQGQLVIIFLNDKFKKSYDLGKKEIFIKNAYVRPENISEQIILKEIKPEATYTFLWGMGVFLLGLVLIYFSRFFNAWREELKRISEIKNAVKNNDYEFILKNNQEELRGLKKFLIDHLYKKDWESSYKEKYDILKEEFFRV